MEASARILILLENEPYPLDTRVTQVARTLKEVGYDVTVASPARPGFTAPEEDVDGVRVLRFPAPPEGTGPISYFREYAAALRRVSAIVRRLEREAPPDLVIACNPPDFLLLAARAARRRGAHIVFDHHDLAPELFEEKFGRRGLLHRVLLAAERWSLRRADVVMSVNDSYAEIARSRGKVEPERVFVVRNAPHPDRIHAVEPDESLRRGRKHLVTWLGRMSVQEGLGAVIEAADELRRRGRDDVSFALVGPGDARAQMENDVRRRGLEEIIVFPGRVDAEGVRRYVSTASVCLSVDPRGPLNDRSTMIKVLEYMTIGRPVVQTPLPEMVRLCGDATAFAQPGDPVELADRIEELLDDPRKAAELGDRGRRRIAEIGLTWRDQVPSLLEAVQTALISSSN